MVPREKNSLKMAPSKLIPTLPLKLLKSLSTFNKKQVSGQELSLSSFSLLIASCTPHTQRGGSPFR
jgi:hypothetical protein